MKTITRIIIALVFIMLTERANSLTIIRDFLGGTAPTNNTGDGNLTNIFNTACDVWEQAVLDNHTIVIHYGWASVGGGLHILNTQGGYPNRETEGTIWFNNNNNPLNESYWLDPTPLLNEEYTNYQEEASSLGGGSMNVTRHFTGPASGPQKDLFTTALHEIGHALGMSSANTSFINEGVDLDIDVTNPRPYVGTAIPLQTNKYGLTSHISYIPNTSGRSLMSGSFSSGERLMPSELDIVALAQLSGFSQLNLKLAPRLKIVGPYVTTTTMKKSGKWITVNMNTVVLSWIQPIDNYIVEISPDLTNWSSVTNVPAITNCTYNVTISTTNSNSFFRLKRN